MGKLAVTKTELIWSGKYNEDGLRRELPRVCLLPPVIQENAYRDTWGRGLSSYLSMLWQRLPLLPELLSDTGSLCPYEKGSHAGLPLQSFPRRSSDRALSGL